MSDKASSELSGLPEAKEIPAELITASGQAYQLIIPASDASQVESRKRWFSYYFPVPVFVTRVEVLSSDLDKYNECEFRVYGVDGKTYTGSAKFTDGIARIRTGRLASGVEFRPPSKFISKALLSKVRIIGLTSDEFNELEDSVAAHAERLVKFEEDKQRLDAAKLDFQNLAGERLEVESAVGKAKAELEGIQLEVKAAEQKRALADDNLQKTDERLKMGRAEHSSLRKEISQAQTDLNDLVGKIRLFPTEISGFVKEGNRNIRWYSFLALPFIIILYILLSRLLSNAVDLTQIWRKDEQVSVWTIFLTRLPFVLVAIALIEGCIFVVGRLIFEIIRINRQRLELSKLSIIARDVSTASAAETDMDADEKFRRETELKMDLLREHFKNYSSSEFEYRGSPIISAIVAVANKWSGQKTDVG